MAERTVENLNEKEVSFCEHYTNLGADSCSNGTASAKLAGYAEVSAHTSAWKLLQRPPVQEKIKQLHAQRMGRHLINADRILFDLEHTRTRALAKDDLAVATRCSELMGKTLAMFTDVQVLDEPARRDLDEQEQAEATELARLRLASKYNLTSMPAKLLAEKAG
jgi:phage terminase small subunit